MDFSDEERQFPLDYGPGSASSPSLNSTPNIKVPASPPLDSARQLTRQASNWVVVKSVSASKEQWSTVSCWSFRVLCMRVPHRLASCACARVQLPSYPFTLTDARKCSAPFVRARCLQSIGAPFSDVSTFSLPSGFHFDCFCTVWRFSSITPPSTFSFR